MDTQPGIFSGDDGTYADAPGIEPPPMIGQDERRMHVRAYNFWAKLLDGRCFPSIEALDVDDLGDFGPNALLLDFTAGIDNPAVVFVGETLARECDIDEGVAHIDDVPRRSLLSRLTDHYLQIIANRAPIGFEAEFVNARGATILYRGVLLPFSSDDDTIDFIMGVINWKQAADGALASSIADEMEAAAAAAPPRRPTLPVWTDGPATAAGHDEDEEEAPLPASSALSGLIRPRGASLVHPAAEEGGDDDVFELDASFAVPGEPAAPPAIDTAPDGARPAREEAGMALADWLAAARELAENAAEANARGHAALYLAIGRARGFALAAASAPGDYAELLDEAGLAPNPRAPMTPLVKLVFGAHHDKTRLAEVAAILIHAEREGIAAAALPAYLGGYQGGMKALLRTIRAANRPAARSAPTPAAVLGAVTPFGSIDWPEAPEGNYVLLLARREADGTHALIAASGDRDGATQRYMAQVAREVGRIRTH